MLAGPFLHERLEANDELLQIVNRELRVFDVLVIALVLEPLDHRLERLVIFVGSLLDTEHDVAIDFEFANRNDKEKAFDYSEKCRARSLLTPTSPPSHHGTKEFTEPDNLEIFGPRHSRSLRAIRGLLHLFYFRQVSPNLFEV